MCGFDKSPIGTAQLHILAARPPDDNEPHFRAILRSFKDADKKLKSLITNDLHIISVGDTPPTSIACYFHALLETL